jgi:hypothetical protein
MNVKRLAIEQRRSVHVWHLAVCPTEASCDDCGSEGGSVEANEEVLGGEESEEGTIAREIAHERST